MKMMSLLAALLSGILLTMSMPGSGSFSPVLFVALVPLLVGVSRVSPGRAAFLGLVCGFCHYLGMLYWIVIVLSTYGGISELLSVLGLICFAIYMSLYLTIFGWLSSRILQSSRPVMALIFLPLLWVGLDWLRSILFTGIPWMDLGYGLYEHIELIQVADLVGHYGLTWLILLANVGLTLALAGRVSVWSRLAALVLPLAMLVGSWMYGQARVVSLDQEVKKSDSVLLGVVQGNIDQSLKWSPGLQQTTVDKYLELSQSLVAGDRPELIVWPETALPFYPQVGDNMKPLSVFVAESGIPLLSGAPWFEIVDYDRKEVKYFNSGFLLNPDGQLGGRYNKSHLVPFGEYVPLKKYLPFLAPLVENVGDFSPGSVDAVLAHGEVKAGVLICFESVFPEITRKWVEAGANVLVNLTNDAWYGKSSAPHQSLAMSVLRAVESRRSVVRSANTGYSAFIGPDGRVNVVSGLFEDWAGKSRVVLLDSRTVWTEYGHYFGPLALLFSLPGMVLRRRERRGLQF